MEISERDEVRFWSKVALPVGEGCLLWMAGLNGGRYGKFSLGGQYQSAHRVSYVLAYGPIPEGLVLDHLCRVRHCVAPLHLEAVTQRENTLRGMTGHHNATRTHCPQGHPYAGENLIIRPTGRGCRECRRERGRSYRRRQRAFAKAWLAHSGHRPECEA